MTQERIDRSATGDRSSTRLAAHASPTKARATATQGSPADPLARVVDPTAGVAVSSLDATRIRRAIGPRSVGRIDGPLGDVAPNGQGSPRIRRAVGPSPIGREGGPVDDAVAGRIRASTGRPLEPSTASRMGAAFGADLSDVRVHTDANAAALSDSLNAQAFTVGSDVFFGADQYRPSSSSGEHLLAHELAHTMQHSEGAHRKPVVRRKIKLKQDPSLAPDTVVKLDDLRSAIAAAGITLQPADTEVKEILTRWFRAKDIIEFIDAATMIQEARTQAAERAKQKKDVTPFALKAEEAKSDSDHDTRLESPSGRYDFRDNLEAKLPDIGTDPTQKKRHDDGPPGYYYHVSSYTNLRGIFATGLNPEAGGGDGGASVQNADKAMNDKSAKDSRNKVFVATVGKLTQRYLSMRLSQNDVLGRHGDCIADVLATSAKLGEDAAKLVVGQICLGEEPVVLRFKDSWTRKDWVLDPVETQAFALNNKPVPPEAIECLSLGGWVPLTTLTAIAEIIRTDDEFKNIRAAVLELNREHNARLVEMSDAEGWKFIPDMFVPILQKKGLA